SSFSSAHIKTDNGDFTIMEWWFAWDAPEACYVVAQLHVIINPAANVDIEDFTVWFNSPGQQCRVVTRAPLANSQGMQLGGTMTAGGDGVGAEVSAGTMVGVDGTQIESSRVEGNTVKWEVDIDDFSASASDGVELDFYAQWSCPKCRDVKQLVKPGMRNTDIRIEFDTDAVLADPNYYWSHSKPKDVFVWRPGEDEAPLYGFPPSIIQDPNKLKDKDAKVETTP
ncbi:MAG TPA: hypothetical protein VIF12_04610, partial [Micavibrio sp.]